MTQNEAARDSEPDDKPQRSLRSLGDFYSYRYHPWVTMSKRLNSKIKMNSKKKKKKMSNKNEDRNIVLTVSIWDSVKKKMNKVLKNCFHSRDINSHGICKAGSFLFFFAFTHIYFFHLNPFIVCGIISNHTINPRT